MMHIIVIALIFLVGLTLSYYSRLDLKRALELRKQRLSNKLDSDLNNMSSSKLKEEVIKIRATIRYHRDQKGHDRCWVDDLRLYELLPEGPVGYDSTLPTEEVFLENCKQFCRSRQVTVGQPFKKD